MIYDLINDYLNYYIIKRLPESLPRVDPLI